jgi:hypothetical protein
VTRKRKVEDDVAEEERTDVDEVPEEELEDEPVEAEEPLDEDEPVEDDEPIDQDEPVDEDEPEVPDAPRGGLKPLEVARKAAQQLAELTGRLPDGVSGIEPVDDGWIVLVDVVEVQRVPRSTDVLATYEVAADRDGDLVRYERIHRFARGRTDSGGDA